MNPVIVTEAEEKVGRLTYEAYFKARAGRNFHDSILLPTWEELGPQNQKAWAAAGNAAVDGDEPPPIPSLKAPSLPAKGRNGRNG